MRRISSVVGLAVLTFSGLATAQTETKAAATYPTAKPGFHLRLDSLGTHSKTEDQPTEDKQTFNIRTARISLTGELMEGVAYYLRLDMRNAFYTSEFQGQDSAIGALDRAYIEQKICDNFLMHFGRLPFFALSVENDYSSIDVYFTSYLNDYMNKTILPINAGFDAVASMAGHSLTFQAANGYQESTVAAEKGSQKGENINTSIGYRGNIANGMVKPIVTYSRFSRIRAGTEPNRDDKVNFTSYGVGSQFTFGEADIDLEYDGYNKPSYTSYKIDSTTKASTKVNNLEMKFTSIVGQVAYRVTDMKLRPFVKATSDLVKTDGETSLKSSRQGLGIEYRPTAKVFRYHAVAVNMNDETIKANVSTKTNTKQFIVGLAAKI